MFKNRVFSKSAIKALLLALSLGLMSNSSAQSMKEVLDSLLTKVLGDKAKQIEQMTDGFIRTKSVFSGRTWDVKDASQRAARVTALVNEVCYEKLGTVDKVCADYSGKETRRAGFMLMPNGTGESAKIYIDSGRVVVESEKIECTSGTKAIWATSVGLVTKNQAPVVSDIIATGGLGGCS
jgi:hypothetical protein